MSYVVIFLIAALVLRLLFRRKRPAKAKGATGPDRLTRWQDAESRDITRPSDPRTKFCVANIGTAVTIKYNGSRRTITPLRVFTKPQFHKTYVQAQDHGEERTFDIDDMALYAKQMRDLVRSEYKAQKAKQQGKATKQPAPAPVETPPEIDWQDFF